MRLETPAECRREHRRAEIRAWVHAALDSAMRHAQYLGVLYQDEGLDMMMAAADAALSKYGLVYSPRIRWVYSNNRPRGQGERRWE